MVIKRTSFGEAQHWLRGRKPTMDRYLSRFYTPYDWPLIKHFFMENPIQAKHILRDFSKTNDAKMREVAMIFISGKSKIIFIIGMRGGGKTATAFMFAEIVHREIQRPIFYVSGIVNKKALPDWMKVCESLNDVPRGSFAIIDESAIQFSSRRAMTKENKAMSDQLKIARHKDLFLIFITQHMASTDIEVERMKDSVLWKKSNDYSFAVRNRRTQEGKFWDKVRNMMSPRAKEECLFEYPAQRRFIHFTHGLPDCWSDELSKTWRDAKLTNKKEIEATAPMQQVERRVVVIKS